MLKLGLAAIEDILKQYVKNDKIDLTQTLISTLTDCGMGHLLKGTSLEKHLSKQEDIIEKAEKKISEVSTSTVGTVKGRMKKIRKQEAKIENAKTEKLFYEIFSKPINKTTTSAATVITTGIYNANKDKKDE